VITLYDYFKLSSDLKWVLSCIWLFVLLLFAYRKQSNFITKRIRHQKNRNQDGK
jgi:hypothetical protein